MIPLDLLIPEMLLAAGAALFLGNLFVLLRRRPHVDAADVAAAAETLALTEEERAQLAERLASGPRASRLPALAMAAVGLAVAVWSLGTIAAR